MGELDAAEAAVDAVRGILARRRLPFAHHTAPMLTGVAACIAAWRGDVEQGRRFAEAPGQADAVLALATNAYAAMAAYAAGDLALVERLEQWQAAAEVGMQAHLRLTNETHNLDGPALNVHWVRALIEDRRDDALAILRPAYDRCPTSPGMRSYILVPFATELLASGGRDELMGVLVEFRADQRNQNAVIVAVRVLALAAIVAQVVAGGESGFYSNFKHVFRFPLRPAQGRLSTIRTIRPANLIVSGQRPQGRSRPASTCIVRASLRLRK